MRNSTHFLTLGSLHEVAPSKMKYRALNGNHESRLSPDLSDFDYGAMLKLAKCKICSL